MWRQAVALFAIFAVTSVAANPIDPGAYLKALPEGPVILERGQRHWSARYCPDNTCDLLQISLSVKEDEFRRLALGYFIYFAPYIYLKHWQEESLKNNAIEADLELLASPACLRRHGKLLVDCRLRHLASAGKLKVFTIRFDEGERRVTRLRLADVLR